MTTLRDQLRHRYLAEQYARRHGRERRFSLPSSTSPSEPSSLHSDGRAHRHHRPAARGGSGHRGNAGFLYLHGRFVEADSPNGNGALWTYRRPPAGRAHRGRRAPELAARGDPHRRHPARGRCSRRVSIEAGVGNHIASTAALWHFLFPREAAASEQAAARGPALLLDGVRLRDRHVRQQQPPTARLRRDLRLPRLPRQARLRAPQRKSERSPLRQARLPRRGPDRPPGRARLGPRRRRGGPPGRAAHRGATTWAPHLERKQAEAMVERILAWANR